jgi:hypothetical protein
MSAASGTAFRTIAFGDVEGQLWGAAVALGPSGLVVGGAGAAEVVSEPTWTVEGDTWAVAGGGIELHVSPSPEPPAPEDGAARPEIGGLQELCRIHGRATVGGAERAIDCTGTRSEIDGLQEGSVASARAVSSWFGPEEALTVVALRSRRASDHETDLIAATLFDPGGWLPVSDPRLSTTYTDAGNPARTSLELWIVDGENEFPRRAAGEACGTTAAARGSGLELRVAPMRCHSRGLEGAGVYVLATL